MNGVNGVNESRVRTSTNEYERVDLQHLLVLVVVSLGSVEGVSIKVVVVTRAFFFFCLLCVLWMLLG